MTFTVRALAVIAGICLLASACGGNDDDDGDGPESGAQSTATATASSTPALGTAVPTVSPTPGARATSVPTASPTPRQSSDDQPATADQPEETLLALTPVVSLPDPIALVARPGTGGGTGDLYIATRAGEVWLLSADNDEPPEMVLDISSQTTTECENGLLGIAFSPDGSQFYINYTDLRGDSQIVAYPMNGQWVRGDQGRTVLSANQPACNHNGGHITFGPDGYLWIGFGDGGGRDDMFSHGQNLNSLLGTIVRIDPEAEGEADYAIPADQSVHRRRGAARDLGLRGSQPVAVLIRPGHRRPVDR